MPIVWIEWLAVALPTLAILLFEYARHRFLLPLLTMSEGNIVTAILAAAIMYGFVRLFKSLLERSADEVVRVRADKAVVVERQRLAREMHDSVAQSLFYLSVKLRETATLVRSGDKEAACSEIQAMLTYTDDAYRLVKAVIADLKQGETAQDFREAVENVAVRASESLGLQVNCDIARPDVSAVSQQHLVAIIQEALLNAHRHGHAHKADVAVRTTGHGLLVEIADDGAGFDPAVAGQDGHYGLTIMAERTRMIGGELEIQSAPGRGTRITVRVEGASDV